jgi:hypothetical protein
VYLAVAVQRAERARELPQRLAQPLLVEPRERERADPRSIEMAGIIIDRGPLRDRRHRGFDGHPRARPRTLRAHPRQEGRAVHELHREEPMVTVLHQLAERHQVAMRQPSQHAELVLEQREPVLREQAQRLERERCLTLAIPHLVDHAHPARADAAHHREPVRAAELRRAGRDRHRIVGPIAPDPRAAAEHVRRVAVVAAQHLVGRPRGLVGSAGLDQALDQRMAPVARRCVGRERCALGFRQRVRHQCR